MRDRGRRLRDREPAVGGEGAAAPRRRRDAHRRRRRDRRGATRSCCPVSARSARACGRLRASGLEPVAKEAATDGRPFLGVCVGMQMLFDGSDESPDVPGLGVVAGRVTRLPDTVRLPQIGWNTLEVAARQPARAPGSATRRGCTSCTRSRPTRPTTASSPRGATYGRRFAAAIEAGPAVGDAVPPREERRRRAAAADELRRGRRLAHERWICIRRSTCAAAASSNCSRATTTARRVYGDDPVAVARGFEAAGARWIHVVDLDAARSGAATNRAAIEAICAAVDVQDRDRRRCARRRPRPKRCSKRASSASSSAPRRSSGPSSSTSSRSRFPGRVAVGLDARGRDVATHGWTAATGLDLVDARAALRPPGRRRARRHRDHARRHAAGPRPRAARGGAAAR